MSVFDVRQCEEDIYDRLRESQEQVIDSIFPTDYNFTIGIDPYDFNNIVSDKSKIRLKYDFRCYCWSKKNRMSKIFIVKSKDGCPITNKDCIERLIDIGFDTRCNHNLLEGFHKLNDDCFKIYIS